MAKTSAVLSAMQDVGAIGRNKIRRYQLRKENLPAVIDIDETPIDYEYINKADSDNWVREMGIITKEMMTPYYCTKEKFVYIYWRE